MIRKLSLAGCCRLSALLTREKRVCLLLLLAFCTPFIPVSADISAELISNIHTAAPSYATESNETWGTARYGNYLYASNRAKGLLIYDVSGSPVEITPDNPDYRGLNNSGRPIVIDAVTCILVDADREILFVMFNQEGLENGALGQKAPNSVRKYSLADPSAPLLIGSYNLTTNLKNMVIWNDFLVVASNASIGFFDIAQNGANVTPKYTLPTFTSYNGLGPMAIDGNIMYLASVNATQSALASYEITLSGGSVACRQLSTRVFELNETDRTGTAIRDIVIYNNYAFLGSNVGGSPGKNEIYKIVGMDISNPSDLANAPTYIIGGGINGEYFNSVGLVVSGNYLFSSNYGVNGINNANAYIDVIDISNPAAAKAVKTLFCASGIRKASISDGYIYIPNRSAGIYIWRLDIIDANIVDGLTVISFPAELKGESRNTDSVCLTFNNGDELIIPTEADGGWAYSLPDAVNGSYSVKVQVKIDGVVRHDISYTVNVEVPPDIEVKNFAFSPDILQVGTITASASLYNNSGAEKTAILILVLYKNGQFVKLAAGAEKAISVGGTPVSATITIDRATAGYSLEAYFWDSENNVLPLYKSGRDTILQ